MNMWRLIYYLGWLVTSLGIVGFLTVADDVRHIGELLAAGVVLASGLLLIVAGRTQFRDRRVAALYTAAGLAAGAILGAATDAMLLAVSTGAFLGVAAGITIGRRSNR